jgi:hypothetical protein
MFGAFCTFGCAGMKMPGCRFYLMSHEDHIIGVREGFYDLHQDAEQRALEILNNAQWWVYAIEGWDKAKLICRVVRNRAEPETTQHRGSTLDADPIRSERLNAS